MGMAQLDEEDLELLLDDPQSFQDTSEISFTSVPKGKYSLLSLSVLKKNQKQKFLLTRAYSSLSLNSHRGF